MFLKRFLFLAPEPGDTGSDDMGDRGDDFVPTDGDDGVAAATAVAADAAAEAAALEKDLAEAAEVVEEAKADDKKAKTKADARIPLARHEDILAKEREKRQDVERQLAQFHDGASIKAVNAEIDAHEEKIAAMQKEYGQLLSDNEPDKAAAVLAAIRRADRDVAEARSDMKIQAAEIRAVERTRYGTTLERIEASFPTLNPDHESFDEAVMADVVELKDAYQLKGLTPTAALQKAVKLIVGATTTRQEVATSTTARVTEKDLAAERKKSAVTKTVETVAKTPPTTKDVGVDSDRKGGGKLDARQVVKMSQREFAQLNEDTLAEMRGDRL